MDLSAFYGAFSPACFALLGLWLVAVQVRLPVWEKDPERRRRSYGVALHFALPGQTLLVFLGFNVAWLLLLDDTRPARSWPHARAE